VINDLYVRGKDGERFMFVGKVARKKTVEIDEALQIQKLLIIEHAQNLNKLMGTKAVQFWYTDGNKEVSVASNEVGLTRSGLNVGQIPKIANISSQDVGFMPEVYEPGEPIFTVEKGDDGSCLRAPVSPQIVSEEQAKEQGML